MINRATDLLPRPMIDELLRLYRLNPEWVQFARLPDGFYQALPRYSTWLRAALNTGADAFGMWGLSIWLGTGPKIVRPSLGQCEALERVDVNLEIGEYTQPYPTVLVDLPAGPYTPFKAVLLHHSPDHQLLTAQLLSRDHADDIVTTITQDARPIEQSLEKYDDDCASLAATAARTLRCSLNLALAMTHFDFRARFLFPKEVESDRRLSRGTDDRAERARERLTLHPQLVEFAREVRLAGSPDPTCPQLGPQGTGGEKATHWRRGHWAMQPCGPGRNERRRIYRAPVMVRADKFGGDPASTTTVYH